MAYKINDIEYAFQNGQALPEFTEHEKIQGDGLDHCKLIEHVTAFFGGSSDKMILKFDSFWRGLILIPFNIKIYEILNKLN